MLVIADSTFEAVDAMLQYIYNGEAASLQGLPPGDKNAKKAIAALRESVLKLADRYKLHDLKAHVGGLLAEGIDKKTFFHLVYLSYDHQCECLGQECCLFFAQNRAAIEKTSEWKKLMKERSELAAILTQAVPAVQKGKK